MFSKIAILRFSIAIFALLNAAAHLFPSPSGSMAGQFWFNLEVVAYTLIAIMCLLGLKRWYPIFIAYSVLNITLFFLAGVIAMPGITQAPLSANLNFMSYDISRLFSVASYLYLIVVGSILLMVDKGSKLEELY
ncbi:MAG: hypothetical protein KGH54_04310 [Candidatus Micrarchaeota archaeon]|nr:hypothetical protein [Candidatus Micrarchaeota archaeon]